MHDEDMEILLNNVGQNTDFYLILFRNKANRMLNGALVAKQVRMS